MTCWKAIRSLSNSTNVFSIPVQSHSEVSTITVTTRQAKCFLKVRNCTVQLWPFQCWLNSIMLAKFVLMFLIKFFNYSTEMHSYNTRFAFSRKFVVNSILQECRSYAKLWSSTSPDVRRLPKFKFRKALGYRRLALRSHVIFSAMLEGKQIGCYGKQWLPRGITKGQSRKYLHW